MHIPLLIDAWFTDHNSKPQKMEDEINVNLVID